MCKTCRFDDFRANCRNSGRVIINSRLKAFDKNVSSDRYPRLHPTPLKMAHFLSYASLFLVVSFSFLPGHCQTFGTGFSSRSGRQSLPRPLQTQSRQHRPMKSVVNYLGTDFLLQDGCPEPRCDPTKVIYPSTYSYSFLILLHTN